MGSMALGLFATLLIGTIFETLGQYTGWALLTEVAGYAKGCTGAALGIAIAHSLQAPPLVMLCAAVAGMMGNGMAATFGETTLTAGPAGAFVVCIVAVVAAALICFLLPDMIQLVDNMIGILTENDKILK